MSQLQKTATEIAYQNRFVDYMKKYKWTAPDYLHGNKQTVSVQDLILNWREELNRINQDQLEGVALTDNEFKQVMARVNGLSNSYEAAKLLAMESSTGKIDGIYRDPDVRVTKEQVTLTIFKKAAVRGGDSSYKIAREVVTDFGHRFDLVLLINGLPLINVEQKRADVTVTQAFYQFKRYYAAGEFTNNFMAFSQMMVINSETKTRYFATPKSINDFNESFVFHWSNEKNHAVNDWQQVIEQFLMIPMAHQMVGDYVVIDEAKDEENQRHMIMRPYQVYALQKIEAAAFGWDNPEKIPHGGFVWHTTGSGKTITSFKTALFLSTRGNFDKVIFLVDRRDLDKKTSDDFKAYARYESVEVDDTPSTYQLRKKLLDTSSGIVVTTTFKLNALVKSLEEGKDDVLKSKEYVFIIDEAHRTTMGNMMGAIQQYFKHNGLFFGFTGTPLFEENEVKGKINQKSEVINTTEKLFGPNLHSYTIDEAISDRNVLGFHVDYINTGEFSSYDSLRESWMERNHHDNPTLTDRELEREAQKLTEVDLEKEDLFKYQDETHIPRVVSEILSNWEQQSQQREFNAILTVAYKKRVIAYYHEFKRQLKEKNQGLNVAMTFSFGNENEEGHLTVDKELSELMFKDYAEFTGIAFKAGDKKHGEEAYFEDIVDRAKRGGSGRNPKNIDLVIVADQLLTGYDSKLLNTLYVDRSLELQGLVQAYSRTNRIYGKNKEFGTIINYRYPAISKELVNRALKLYGSGGKSENAIVETYEVAVHQFASLIPELRDTLVDPTDWQSIKEDEEKRDIFLEIFMEIASKLNRVKQYYEYEWEDETFSITEHHWLKYVGAFRNIVEEIIDPPELDDVIPLVNRSKLVDSQRITAGYIISLIDEKVDTSGNTMRVDGETMRIIYEQIQELSNLGEHQESEQLKTFVDEELIPGNISTEMNFDEAFEAWKKDRLKGTIGEFADNWGIDNELLCESFSRYTVSKAETIPYIEEITASLDFDKAKDQSAGNQLMHHIKLSEELPKWMNGLKNKYD